MAELKPRPDDEPEASSNLEQFPKSDPKTDSDPAPLAPFEFTQEVRDHVGKEIASLVDRQVGAKVKEILDGARRREIANLFLFGLTVILLGVGAYFSWQANTRGVEAAELSKETAQLSKETALENRLANFEEAWLNNEGINRARALVSNNGTFNFAMDARNALGLRQMREADLVAYLNFLDRVARFAEKDDASRNAVEQEFGSAVLDASQNDIIKTIVRSRIGDTLEPNDDLDSFVRLARELGSDI